jgi:hypothetical protein
MAMTIVAAVDRGNRDGLGKIQRTPCAFQFHTMLAAFHFSGHHASSVSVHKI